MNRKLYSVFMATYSGELSSVINLTPKEVLLFLYKGYFEHLDGDLKDAKSWTDDRILDSLYNYTFNCDYDYCIFANGDFLKEESPITDQLLILWFRDTLKEKLQ